MAHETSELKKFIREGSADDLQKRFAELKEEHFRLRCSASLGGVDNPKRSWFLRKAIARIKTELRQRELQGEQA